ncbi:hypothetical protein P8C59_004881 [Phyllachora maydis]|uniref:Integral membrane protein n=1 Tax=Phyllachora maydis TaxID=1825666 RepID=A0AAD9I3C0_9PEZI|nr:hypothetical protein P8C59_004881 [Phyllachora maydis]
MDNYTVPPFPALGWPPQDPTRQLRSLPEMWRFTLLWTLAIYAIFHLSAASIAIIMHTGKTTSDWKYLCMVPLVYTFVAGVEALIAGSVTGAIVGTLYLIGNYQMSTWVPFVWAWINVLVLIISSFSIQGERVARV